MLRRLQGSLLGPGRRLTALGSRFVDTFLCDNKVIPVVLALLALSILGWVVAGAFLGEPDEERVSRRAEVAQTQNSNAADPAILEVENRDLNSYAAYQFKDPFRQLVAPRATTTSTTTPTSTPTALPAGGGQGNASGDDGGRDDGGDGGGILDGSDSDGDGLSDRKEFDLGLDPTNPDTDGDSILDGQDEEARRRRWRKRRSGRYGRRSRCGAWWGRPRGATGSLTDSGGEGPLPRGARSTR